MDQGTRGMYDLIAARLDDDPDVRPDVRDTVLAAVAGDDLAAEPVVEPSPDGSSSATDAQRQGPEIYLAGIDVEGFRGVGPRATLPLRPGSGLTLVTGRNGSGKSSFAEAAELALTGNLARWSEADSGQVSRSGWRNLHAEEPAVAVRVDLVAAGTSGSIRIERTWGPDDRLDGASWTRTASGAGEPAPFDGEPWRADLSTYRPFLSYSELGKVIDGKPTELHDTVHNLLGLEALTGARERLRLARKKHADVDKRVGDSRKSLRADLNGIDHPHAERAAILLRATSPTLEAIAELAGRGNTDPAGSEALTALAGLEVPDESTVQHAVGRLRRAVDTVTERTSDRARTAERTSALLRAALDHPDAGDGPCPVCGVGTLDETWRAEAARRVADLDAESTSLRDAARELEEAVAAARGLTRHRPGVLDRQVPIDVDELGRTWSEWQEAGRAEGPTRLAAAIDAAVGPLLAAAREARDRAATEVQRRDEVWAPFARRLGTWHDEAVAARAAGPELDRLTRATKWLTEVADSLRDARLAPFADHSQHIWRTLRQQSNVDLGGVSLTGRAHMRRVSLNVHVDGTDGGTALGVMSQGELHALGLSLFLPRATVEQSPFRFIVIDDPVQAMDPAKVDGLARVLSEAATNRQVVVFTHDDRLAEAVRRLDIPATVLEVRRAERSRVAVHHGDDPVERYLDDARAMARTTRLPADLRSELVATCCRSALEAVCHARIRERRLTRGDRHVDVEDAIAKARKTDQLVTLAVFDDPDRGRETLPAIRTACGSAAVSALQGCRSGAHLGLPGNDLRPFVQQVERLATWLRG